MASHRCYATLLPSTVCGGTIEFSSSPTSCFYLSCWSPSSSSSWRVSSPKGSHQSCCSYPWLLVSWNLTWKIISEQLTIVPRPGHLNNLVENYETLVCSDSWSPDYKVRYRRPQQCLTMFFNRIDFRGISADPELVRSYIQGLVGTPAPASPQVPASPDLPPSYENLVSEQEDYPKGVIETPPPCYEEVVSKKESLWTYI